METRTYNVYKFDELTNEQKEKAIDNLRDINADYEWSQFAIEDETEDLQSYGFDNVKIYYSGFWSQGDGACFEGTLDNNGVLAFLEKTHELSKYKKLVRAIKSEKIYINIKIKQTGHYYHENSTTLEDYTEMQDNSDLPDALQKEYTAWYESFDARGPRNESIGWYYDTCRKIYKRLEGEDSYQTSDPAIIETIQANDYDFTADGKIA